MGVWIETLTVGLAGEISKSLLMWECGLKQMTLFASDFVSKSLLMWECGLKPYIPWLNLMLCIVTPYVGVWIETRSE